MRKISKEDLDELLGQIDRVGKYVIWGEISENYLLDEEFIEENKDNVNWFWISRKQRLSENIIEKYSDRVYWNEIALMQELSEEFIYRNKDKINFYFLCDGVNVHKYSYAMQDYILGEIIDDLKSYELFILTDYMRMKYEKLRIML